MSTDSLALLSQHDLLEASKAVSTFRPSLAEQFERKKLVAPLHPGQQDCYLRECPGNVPCGSRTSRILPCRTERLPCLAAVVDGAAASGVLLSRVTLAAEQQRRQEKRADSGHCSRVEGCWFWKW